MGEKHEGGRSPVPHLFPAPQHRLVTPAILEEIDQPVVEDLLQAESIEGILPVRGISIGD